MNILSSFIRHYLSDICHILYILTTTTFGCKMAITYKREATIMKIIKNAIQCRKCGAIIESKHVHDFVTCSCGAIAVDGGHDYLRRCGYKEDIIELSIVNND